MMLVRQEFLNEFSGVAKPMEPALSSRPMAGEWPRWEHFPARDRSLLVSLLIQTARRQVHHRLRQRLGETPGEGTHDGRDD